MISGIWLLMGLGLLAGQGGLPNPAAGPRYLLSFARAGQGATVRVEKENCQRQQVRIEGDERADEQVDTLVYRETIVELPARGEQVTHLWRLCDEARRKNNGKTLTLPEQGQTYDIQKVNGEYRFYNVSGAALPPEVTRRLELEFNSGSAELNWEKLLLPRDPVPTGASWKVVPDPIIHVLSKLTGLQFDVARCEAGARLSQVTVRAGRLFTVVDATVTLPATAVHQGSTWQPLQPGSGVRVQMRLTGALGAGPEDRAGEIYVEIVKAGVPQARKEQRAVITTSTCMIRQHRLELPRQ